MNTVIQHPAFSKVVIIYTFFLECRLGRSCVAIFKTLILFSNVLFETSCHITIRPTYILYDKSILTVYITQRIIARTCSCDHCIYFCGGELIRAIHI